MQHSPPRRGGVAAAPMKSREATEAPQPGGQFGEMFRPEDFAELLLRLRPIGLALRATPAAQIGRGTFSSWRSHPSSARRGIMTESRSPPSSIRQVVDALEGGNLWQILSI